MGSFGGISEIVELDDNLNSVHHSNKSKTLSIKVKADKSDVYPLEDDLDRLIKAISLRTSSRALGPSSQTSSDLMKKNALKKPVRVGPSQASGIGISEPVTLKQALRRLCISQASEMASMKRLTKPAGVSGFSESGLIKKIYASVEEKRNVVEISIVPEEILPDASIKKKKCCKRQNLGSCDQMAVPSPHTAVSASVMPKMRILDVIKPMYAEEEDRSPASLIMNKGILETSISSTCMTAASKKVTSTPRAVKQNTRNKTSVKNDRKSELTSPSGSSSQQQAKVNKDGSHSISTLSCHLKEPMSKNLNPASTVVTKNICSDTNKLASSPSSYSGGKSAGGKISECPRSGEKGECSHSSKSSMGDYSSGTSISDESHQSGTSCNGSRPHMSKDIRWVAIHEVLTQQGGLGLKDFKLLKKLGCGDIGTVYVAELMGTECLFALKVMDIDFLISRKKMIRAQTEREILQMLDHPFLPTLYSHFTTDNLSCLVMEYCPGGDLHVLRQKQPTRCFNEPAARFYVAEVLLALEYLHMLGVIYRDLKPENILVREDGHIMLSDFDLSLRCSVSPTLLRSSSLGTQESSKKMLGPCAENSCIDPTCLQPSWVQASCFTPRLVSSTVSKTRKLKADMSKQVSPLPQLVVEPTDARSNSFVGTHEYLAPEIIRGDGHGSAVDWWTFGIFLYELLFGRTPFKGPGNEETLTNVICQSLKFPENPSVSFHAKDLIRGLLIKEPENRLGSVKGAAEIKQHPFFEGLNWALIRCATPPETPGIYDFQTPLVTRKKKEGKCLDFRSNGGDVEFELF